MKIKQSSASKDENSKNKILVEINNDDILIIRNAIAVQEEIGKYDKDDIKYIEKFNHVKQQVHETWKLLWPS